jgi:hypothetical protein
LEKLHQPFVGEEVVFLPEKRHVMIEWFVVSPLDVSRLALAQSSVGRSLSSLLIQTSDA